MNKKIILLGALTLCITTASFAMNSFSQRVVLYGIDNEPKNNNEDGNFLKEFRKRLGLRQTEKCTITHYDKKKATQRRESAIRDLTPLRELHNLNKEIRKKHINTQKDEEEFNFLSTIDAIVTLFEKITYYNHCEEYNIGPDQPLTLIFYHTQSDREKEKKRQKKERQKKKKYKKKKNKRKTRRNT